MIKFILLSLMMLIVPMLLKGQASLYGTIVNQNNVPLEFAEILLFRSDTLAALTITEKNGLFSFKNLDKGDYKIKVQYIGYKSVLLDSIKVSENQLVEIATIQLMNEATNLNEIIVTAQVPLIERIENKIRINISGNNQLIGDNGRDIIKKLPSVQYNNLTGQLLLNGRPNVQLQIDGNLIPLSISDALDLISTLPTTDILAVELNMSPSASSDASGSGGVINIITTKSLGWGNKFQINASAGGWNYGRWQGDVTHSFNLKKIRITTVYSYSDLNTFNRNTSNLILGNNQTTFGNVNARFNPYNLDKHNLRNVINWQISDKTDINFSTVLSNTKNKNRTFSDIDLVNENNIIDTMLNLFSIEDGISNRYFFNFGIVHRFKRSEINKINFFVDLVGYDMDYQNLIQSNFFDKSSNQKLSLLQTRSETPTNLSIWSAKLDYETSAWKFPLSFGVKFSDISNINSAFVEQRDAENAPWLISNLFTNQVDYKENISAAYINYAPKHLNTDFNLGLRVEHTFNKIEQSSDAIERTRLDFFPSIVATNHLIGEHYLTLSYDRRIDRQLYEDLNQFTYFVDNFTWLQGNPLLNPQITNTFQMLYSYQNKYQATFLHSRTKDVFTSVVAYSPEFGIRNTTGRMINTPFSTLNGLNFVLPEEHKNWTITNVIGIYHAKNKLEISGDNPINSKNYVTIQSLHSLNLKDNWQLGSNLFFQSSFVYSFYRFDPIFVVDLSLQRQLFNGKGNIKFSLTDVGYLNRYKGNSQNFLTDVQIIAIEQWESRLFRVSLSYKFGNNKVSDVRVNEITTSEKNRIKRDVN